MDVKPLSQRDTKWSSVLLGFNTSTYTIGGYGCLITCIAVACNYYGKSETPLTINSKLKTANGFSNGGFYNWGAIEKIFSDIDEQWLGNYPNRLTDAQMKTINDAIDSGYPVLVEVDFNPLTSPMDMHYVLLTARNKNDENDFTMMDPWTGSCGSLKLYLKGTKPDARTSIAQVTIYKGKVPQTPVDILGDLTKRLEDALKQNATLRGQIDTLQEDKIKQANEIATLKTNAENEQKKYSDLKFEHDQTNAALAELTKEQINLKAEYDKLEAAAQGNPLDAYTGIQLINLGLKKLIGGGS